MTIRIPACLERGAEDVRAETLRKEYPNRMAREKTKRITSIGGQALIEGIMMRGPKRTEISVRLPDGTISSEAAGDRDGLREKYKIFRLPIFRGIAAFIDSLSTGFKALSISAEKSGMAEEGEPSRFDQWMERVFGDKLMNAIMAVGTVLGAGSWRLCCFSCCRPGCSTCVRAIPVWNGD